MVRVIPREMKFFDMFVEMSNNLTAGAKVLVTLFDHHNNVAAVVQKIKDIEHQGDDLTHALLKKLNQTFITPFDREDIHRLASSVDDVLDFINAAAERMLLYKIQNPPAAAGKLAEVIVRQTEEIAAAMALLERDQDGVLAHCVKVNQLENEADAVCRAAIGALFDTEKDPITLIKNKELFEVLEMATDKAEDAANVLEAVVLKSA
jgi:predicted phosphate transport protein (TIGR00153 family)